MINSSRKIFLLIILLTITPFILFLGKNFLLTEFFTVKYFYFAFIYLFTFLFVAILANHLHKNFLILVVFFAYFSFLQFYFLNMQEFLKIYKDGSTGFYILFFILSISFFAALFSKFSIFTNFVFIILLLNIAISINNLMPATFKILQSFFETTNSIDNFDKNKIQSTNHPNIFYIIPDGLASPKILKNYADIDFKDSIKEFEDKGFDVPISNYSSYNSTHLSLAALFKMDYPVTEKSPKYKDRKNFYPAMRENNPKLPEYLKKNNYKFVIAPSRWGGCPPSKLGRCLEPQSDSIVNFFLNDYSIETFLDNSLLKRIIYLKNLLQEQDMDDSIKTTLKRMKKNPKIWSEGAVFTLIHAMMPHTPYRNQDCSIIKNYINHNSEGYKSTVYCTFNRIHELTDHIIKNYPNATIVVQSDHGVGTTDYYKDSKFVDLPESYIDARLSNFTAVRGCNSDQAVKLNQVNIVKYIIECSVSGKPPKFFENKSYFSFNEKSPDYGKVFRIH